MEIFNYKTLSSEEKENIALTISAMDKAYAPYSQFKVGALVLSTANKKFTGCNIESADYTLTSHAEMTAINNMVSSGQTLLKKIYIALNSDEIPVPCGLCRQKITEFAENTDIPVITINIKTNPYQIYKFTLNELYPYPFSKKH